jgi:hypothetical protein
MAIVDGAGDIMKTFDILVHKGTPRASTALTKGQVVINRGGGYRPVAGSEEGPFFVALETVASAASPSYSRFLKRGVIRLSAHLTVNEGDWVQPARTAFPGEIEPWASPAGTGNLKMIVGVALEDISADAVGKVLIGY